MSLPNAQLHAASPHSAAINHHLVFLRYFLALSSLLDLLVALPWPQESGTWKRLSLYFFVQKKFSPTCQCFLRMTASQSQFIVFVLDESS
jgi:hypothetical protein